MSLNSFGAFPININEKITSKNNLIEKESNKDINLLNEQNKIIPEREDDYKTLFNKIDRIIHIKSVYIDFINEKRINILKYHFKKLINQDKTIEELQRELLEFRKFREKVEKQNLIKQLRKKYEKEKSNLIKIKNQNVDIDNQLKEIVRKIQNINCILNQNKLLMKQIIEKKNYAKKEFEKANQIAINDNKFCHENFYSSLTLFPYYKNVIFISLYNKDVKEPVEEEEKLSIISNNKIIEENTVEYHFEDDVEDIISLIEQKKMGIKNFHLKY